MGWPVYKGKNVRIEWNEKGFDELRKSPEVEAWLNDIATNTVMQRLGKGYGYEIKKGKKRLVCNVFPKTAKARKENLDKNTLLKAIGGKAE